MRLHGSSARTRRSTKRGWGWKTRSLKSPPTLVNAPNCRSCWIFSPSRRVASSAEHAGRPRTIAIVAGEASGDLLGSQLILALRELVPELNVVGIGGPRLEAARKDVGFPLEKLALGGHFEVLQNFF